MFCCLWNYQSFFLLWLSGDLELRCSRSYDKNSKKRTEGQADQDSISYIHGEG